MKTTNKIIGTMIIFFMAVLTFTACSPEDGKDGVDGEQGAIGNANVIFSDWITFPQSQRDTLIDGTNLKVNHFAAPGLTQDVIDTGAIQVYMRFITTVFQLPYTSDAGSGNQAHTVSFIPRPSKMLITRYTHNNSGSVGFGNVQWRYVLIPRNTSAANSRLKNIDYSELSYEEICDMFNIPE